MTSYAATLIEKYRHRGLILDSNLLLLHLVGTLNMSLVGAGSYRRLSAFQQEELFVLRRMLTLFPKVVTTPHVLTEVSNLVNDLDEVRKKSILQGFAATLEVIEEQMVPSYAAARRSHFHYLGLTDSILAEMSGRYLIVSADGRMINLLRHQGIEALKWVEVLGLST